MAVIDLGSGEKIKDTPEQANISNEPTAKKGGVIDLDTGKFIDPSQPKQPVNEGGFFEFATGTARKENNPELETLPEFGTTEEGNTLKMAANLLATFDEKAIKDVIQKSYPQAVFETTEDGSTIIEVPTAEGGIRRSVLNRPGFSPQDLTTGVAQVLAFIPASALANVGKKITEKVALGFAGAGVTEQLMQELGVLFGRKERDPVATATAATLGGLSEVVAPVIQRVRGARNARNAELEADEVARAVDTAKPLNQAVDGVEAATGVKVGLFPAQQTQAPSQLLKQRILPQLDAGARKASEALERQNKESFKAVSSLIDTIAPPESVATGASRFRTASQKAIEAGKTARSEATKEMYKNALDTGAKVKLSPVKSMIADVLDDAPEGGEITKVFNKINGFLKGSGDSAPTLRKLQKARFEIDAMIEKFGDNSLSTTTKREVVNVRRALTRQMEDASPLFKAANEKFAELSPAVEQLHNSIIGRVSELSDAQLKSIAQNIFDPKEALTNPTVIRNAKKVIDKVDPGAWEDLIRVEVNRRIGGLQEIAGDLSGESVSNMPGQLRRALFGNPSQRNALLSGMSEAQKKNFIWLDDVLKRASSGRASGSPTAAFGQAIDKLKGVSMVVRDAIFKPLSTIQGAGEKGLFDRNVARLTDVMFDPNFTPKMNKLRSFNPESPAAARAMAQLLNVDDNQEGNK